MNKAEYALADYKVGKKLAHGGFGYVFSGEAKDGTKVALKYERTYNRINRPYLQYEAAVYRLLVGDPCVPRMHAYGREIRWNIMVTDLLGTSLESLLEKCGDSFSFKTVFMLAPQMIDCIQYVHSKGVLHRDIKPDNFLMGLPGTEGENKVHIVDFGLARRYTHPKTGKHLPRTDGHSFFGTKRFASLAALDGKTQGRKDDIESISYSLIYFLRDSLPWQGLRGGTDKHRDMRVREKKRSWSAARLCEGLPGEEELVKMLDYVRNLNYEDEPDYEMLKNLFYDRLKKEGWSMDSNYDWKDLDRGSSSSSSSGEPSQKGTVATEEFPKPPVAVGDEARKEESEETVEIKTDSPAPAVFDPEADRTHGGCRASDTANPVGKAPALDTVQEEDDDADDEKSTAADYNGRMIGSEEDSELVEGIRRTRTLPTPKEALVSFSFGSLASEGASDKGDVGPVEKSETEIGGQRSASAEERVDTTTDVDFERARIETNDTTFFTAESASMTSVEVGNAKEPDTNPVSDAKQVPSAGTSTKTPTKACKDAADGMGTDEHEQPVDVVDGAAKVEETPKQTDKPAADDPKNGQEKKDKDNDAKDDEDEDALSISFLETPLKRGDVVLAKLFARKTLEYDSDDGSEPSDTSYWHNPNLSQEEWKFKYRPGVVTDIQEGDFGYLKVYLLPLMAREDGLEKVAPPRRQAFVQLKGDEKSDGCATDALADSAKKESESDSAANSGSGDDKSKDGGCSETPAKLMEACGKEEPTAIASSKDATESNLPSTETDELHRPSDSEGVEGASPGGEVDADQVGDGKPLTKETAKDATTEESSTKSEDNEKHDIVVETSPAWPLKGSFIHHQYCSFRVNIRPEDTEDIEVKWRLNKESFKRLQSIRSTVFDSLKIHEPYSDDEEETAAVRWRQRKRAGIRSYPIFGELASLTEETFKDPGVIWTGSTGWLPEFQKIDKRRDKENRSEIGSEANHYSDLNDDDENVSNFTGGAPGNRRRSCTLDIGDSEMDSYDFDDFSAMESLLEDEEDDMDSIRSVDTRRTDNSSRVSRASSRSSKNSSMSNSKRPKIQTQKSLRRNLLKEAARVAMNAKWTTESELDSDPELTSPVTPSESVVSTVPPSLVASEASTDDKTPSLDVNSNTMDASSAPSNLKDTDSSSALSAGESDGSAVIGTEETPITSDLTGRDSLSSHSAESGGTSDSSSDTSEDSVRYTRSQKGKWKAVDTDISTSDGFVSDDTSDINSGSDIDNSSSEDDVSSLAPTFEETDSDSDVESDDAIGSDSDVDTSDSGSNPDSDASEFVEGSAGSNADNESDGAADDATESSVDEDDDSDAPSPSPGFDHDSNTENEVPSPDSVPASPEADNNSASDLSTTAEQDQDDLSMQSNFGSSTHSEAKSCASDVLDIPYIPPPQNSFVAVHPPPPPSTGGSVIVDDGGYNRQSSQATRKVMIDRAMQTDPMP